MIEQDDGRAGNKREHFHFSRTYSHEPPNIVLNGAKNAFSSRPPTPSAALLMTSPIASNKSSNSKERVYFYHQAAQQYTKLNPKVIN